MAIVLRNKSLIPKSITIHEGKPGEETAVYDDKTGEFWFDGSFSTTDAMLFHRKDALTKRDQIRAEIKT